MPSRLLTVAAMTMVLLLGAAGRADAQDRRAILELVVNDVMGGPTVASVHDTDVWLPVAALTTAGLSGIAGRRDVIDGQEYVSLSSLGPAVAWTLDERDLTLRVMASTELFASTVFAVESVRPPDLEYVSSPSAYVNYATTWRPGAGADVYLESAGNVGWLSLTSGFSRTAGIQRIVRGQTVATADDRRALRRWFFGDALVGGGPLDGGMVLAGVAVRREFSIDPYRRWYPSASVTGSVATPSTLEVSVDGRIIQTDTLPPGPFQVTRVPMAVGLGDARIVVRDAFGREQNFGGLYYLTTSLLTPGEWDYEYAVGIRRIDNTTGNAQYRSLTGSAIVRRGTTNFLTLGARALGDRRVAGGGPTVTARLWRLGELEWIGSASRGLDTGFGAHLAYEFTSRWMGVAAAVQRFSAGYQMVTTARADGPATRMSVSARLPAGSRLSWGLYYGKEIAAREDSELRDVERRTGLNAAWRASGTLTVYVNASAVRHGLAGTEVEGYAGLSVLLGGRTSAGLTHERSGGREATVVEAQRSLPVGTGVGYRVRGESRETNGINGIVEYQGPYGRVMGARGTGLSGSSASALSASGGLVLIGRGVHLTRAISDSYALIKVDDTPGVRVFAHNQEVGRTGRYGTLLIPDLLPYQANQVGIADADVPIDYEVTATSRSVAPPFHGGAFVRFTTRRLQSVSGTVRTIRGGVEATPAYGEMRVDVEGVSYTSPVGNAGEFYFENLPPGRYPATVRGEGAPCTFSLDVPASSAPFIDVGAWQCKEGDSTGATP